MKKQKELIKETYKDSNVVEGFDNERKRYAFQRYKHKIESKFLIKTLNKFNEPIEILDVACGTGRMLLEVFKSKNTIFYTGIDTSLEMLKELKNKANKSNKIIGLNLGSAINLPYREDCFDVVYTYHLLWHLPYEEQKIIIKELLRVCKPNGYVIFDFLNKDFIFEKIKHLFKKPTEGIYKLSLNEIKEMIGDKDYKIEKLCDFPIKSTLLYKCLNIFNLFKFMLPMNLYHMCFLRIKKGGDAKCLRIS